MKDDSSWVIPGSGVWVGPSALEAAGDEVGEPRGPLPVTLELGEALLLGSSSSVLQANENTAQTITAVTTGGQMRAIDGTLHPLRTDYTSGGLRVGAYGASGF